MLLDTTKTTPAVPMTDSEIYTAAADYMERYGHCKKWFAVDRAVCMWGALSVITGGSAYLGNQVPYRLVLKLESLIDEYLVTWNDRPERTKAEAVALLRRAARDSK